MRIHDKLTVPPDGKPFHEQPQWRNDFPIDVPQDDLVARRDFTKFLVLTSLAFVAGQWWIAAENLLRRRRGAPPVAKIAELSTVPVGGVRLFSYPAETDPCILVRTAENRFLAYSQKCTHLGCAVEPDLKTGQFVCPCHRGIFDMASGNVLAGPPRRPLPRVKLLIRDGVLYATGMEVRS